jgi:DNA-directed RNA polymerase subunit L
MLKHRVELLPVNVSPEDTEIIKNASIHLEKNTKESLEITTDDFTIKDGRDNLIMKDRDLDTPLLFLRLKPNESVHVTASLSLEKGSQVCTAAMAYHIDSERVKNERKNWVDKGEDPRIFDNFYYQKYYSIDEIGRPNWIDLSIESVGVISSQDIMKYAVKELKKQISTWISEAIEKITREGDSYNIKLESGGHTVGALLQEVMYHSGVKFVSYDITHPMKPVLVLRFVTENQPESLLKETLKTISDYCEIVEKVL